MCPEPVAPGYEYSDVVEEVVKLHPPVGQLLLEEIERLVPKRVGKLQTYALQLETASFETSGECFRALTVPLECWSRRQRIPSTSVLHLHASL